MFLCDENGNVLFGNCSVIERKKSNYLKYEHNLLTLLKACASERCDQKFTTNPNEFKKLILYVSRYCIALNEKCSQHKHTLTREADTWTLEHDSVGIFNASVVSVCIGLKRVSGMVSMSVLLCMYVNDAAATDYRCCCGCDENS